MVHVLADQIGDVTIFPAKTSGTPNVAAKPAADSSLEWGGV
jgi:hypothetical protein